MNPSRDILFRVHAYQAARRGLPALPYGQFRSRLPDTYETDLTGLQLPSTGVTVQMLVKRELKFQLGDVCITAYAANAVPPDEVLKALARHVTGDWGELDEHDRRENERALGHHGRLISAYKASNGLNFWVITDSGWAAPRSYCPRIISPTAAGESTPAAFSKHKETHHDHTQAQSEGTIQDERPIETAATAPPRPGQAQRPPRPLGRRRAR